MTDEQRLVAGRYRLLSPLGSGGMGTVWRAEDVLLGREVAVKEVTFPRGLSDEDREVLRERTRREARAAARLDHPSAVTVYDVVEEDGSPFLVMELVEARTLSQVVRADGPLTPQRTAQVGLALLGALETAHSQGIVHRDVKPGNVLLMAEKEGAAGRVVLTDFGIASSPGDSSITSTGLLLGSPSYIAPERARGQSPGPASDLWSLGATLFTAVEGRPPYDGGEPLLTVTAVVTGEHEPFVAAGPLVPVLEGLLERDPEHRLTAAQARAALLPIAERSRVFAAPSPSPAAERRTERTTAMLMTEVRSAAAARPVPGPEVGPEAPLPPV
ncbi:MAG: serine/threonine protein kinase, partial [Frankiales bacterium]|nr:serine/threonine protein kinase [Frankiales bacterium]